MAFHFDTGKQREARGDPRRVSATRIPFSSVVARSIPENISPFPTAGLRKGKTIKHRNTLQVSTSMAMSMTIMTETLDIHLKNDMLGTLYKNALNEVLDTILDDAERGEALASREYRADWRLYSQ